MRTTRNRLILLARVCVTATAALGQEAPGDALPPMSKYLRITVKDGRLAGDMTPPEAAAPPPAGPGGPAAAAAVTFVRESVKVADVDGEVIFTRRAPTMQATVSSPTGSRSISISPTIISLTRTAVDPAGGQIRITLQQRMPAAGAAGPAAANAVTLTVTSSGARGAAAAAPVRLSEPTFGDMWAKHPAELRQYVEPLFREMGMPSIFEVTLQEAQGVFAGLRDADIQDAQVKAKVDELLKELSASSWKERDAARTELVAMGKPAISVLRELSIDDLPVEAAAAVKAALSEVLDSRLSDPDFLLQCVAIDDGAIAGRAAKEYEKVTGHKVGIDLALPAAQRAKQVEAIRMGEGH